MDPNRGMDELEVIDYYEDAKKLYDCKDDILDYMMNVCHCMHTGDNHIKLPLILSYATTRIENCGGIHVSICGDAGSGKSHVADTVCRILPPRATINGRFSNMALFYSPDLTSKKVIIMDDQSLAEEFSEILKIVPLTGTFRTFITRL